MGAAIQLAVTLATVDCGQCGGTYAINERFRDKKREDGGGWTCPYCKCSWGFFGETPAQKNARLLKEEQERHQRTLAQKNEAEAERDRLARRMRRVKHGVCPCCKRSFKALQRHMATKHPEFTP